MLGLSAVLLPAVVQAAPELQIRIAAGSIQDALTSLSRQTGVSIGMAGDLPRRSVKAINGRMSVAAALHRLLRGTGLVAVRVGTDAWRIEPAKAERGTLPKTHAPQRPPAVLQGTVSDVPPVLIVVTAAKRKDPLDQTPIASSVIDGDALSVFGAAPDAQDVARLADGLTLTNIGPGRNRAFLRGIGDSPFSGQTQATVAMIFNDARIGFNAPEPELKLVDIDRIELLKGPQGPLYGTGALGGVYRMVANRPQFDRFSGHAAIGVEQADHGGQGASASAMLNLPLVSETLALRAVAYTGVDPGWIDTDRPAGRNTNREDYRGGRLALSWKAAATWSADLIGAAQFLHVADSQYSNVAGRYRRLGVAAEPHDNDFAHAQLSVSGRVGAFDLLAVTGWTSQEVSSVLDATIAATRFGRTGPLLFNDERKYTLWTQELRLSRQSGAVRTLFGLSGMQARTASKGEISVTPVSVPVPIGAVEEMAPEVALFGELGYEFAPGWSTDVGLRLYRTRVDNELTETSAARRRSRHGGLSPSLALSFRPDNQQYYYTRFATAVRPGGLSYSAPGGFAAFESDELLSVEVGGRWRLPAEAVSIKVEGYASQWSHLQADYLLPNGMVGTRNNGDAIIFGLETSLQWAASRNLDIDAGFLVQHAKLEQAAPQQSLRNDLSLPVVPSAKGHVTASYAFDFGGWNGRLRAGAVYWGATRLALDPQLAATVDDRLECDLSIAFDRQGWRIMLAATNLTSVQGATPGVGNPFSYQDARQYMMASPRRLTLQLRKDF